MLRTGLVLYHLMVSGLVLYHLTVSGLVVCHLTVSGLVLCHLTVSGLVLCHLTVSGLVLLSPHGIWLSSLSPHGICCLSSFCCSVFGCELIESFVDLLLKIPRFILIICFKVVRERKNSAELTELFGNGLFSFVVG